MDPIHQIALNRTKQSIMKVNHQNSTTAHRRRRTVLSCTPCRGRKIKCNRMKPCDRCIQANTPDSCTYSPTLPAPPPSLRSVTSTSTNPVKSSRSNSQYSYSTNHSLAGFDKPLSPGHESNIGDSTASHANGLSTGRHFSPLASPLDIDGPEQHQMREQVSEVSPDAIIGDRHPTSRTTADSIMHSALPFSFRGKQQRTRFFGQSHWATTLSMVKFPPYLRRRCANQTG